MGKLESEGKCYYCNKNYNGSGISRHLSSHLRAIQKENSSNKKSFHVKVTGEGLYFLHLLIGEKTKLENLDSFLRQIWLECCGHLSSFEIKGVKKSYSINDWSFDDEEYGLDMNTKLGSLLKKGMKLNYEYDFGSTTYLEITVINEYSINDNNKITLLSRNEPLELLCDICKKESARVICLMWHDNETMFCGSCSDIHAEKCSDFDDYSKANIVNSPRMGVCGYTGIA